jgi:CheY-like chemotaxis protein
MKAAGTVVIADDARASLELLTTILTRDGYTVHAAQDGVTALELALAESPDVVVTDVVMPKLNDGYSDHSQTWQGNLMPRWQFAFELIRNEIKGTKHNLQNLLDVLLTESLEEDIDSISSLLLGAPLDRLIRDQLIDAVLSAGANTDEALQIITGSLIASPAFHWR